MYVCMDQQMCAAIRMRMHTHAVLFKMPNSSHSLNTHIQRRVPHGSAIALFGIIEAKFHTRVCRVFVKIICECVMQLYIRLILLCGRQFVCVCVIQKILNWFESSMWVWVFSCMSCKAIFLSFEYSFYLRREISYDIV